MTEFDFHSCENCIFHKHEHWYDEDYCGSQHATLVGNTKDKNECLRFMPKTTTVAESEYLKPAGKIYIKELKPEDDARKVEFCLVRNYDEHEFKRRVEKKLNDGWKPIGGVCYERGNYFMGMMRLGNKVGA